MFFFCFQIKFFNAYQDFQFVYHSTFRSDTLTFLKHLGYKKLFIIIGCFSHITLTHIIIINLYFTLLVLCALGHLNINDLVGNAWWRSFISDSLSSHRFFKTLIWLHNFSSQPLVVVIFQFKVVSNLWLHLLFIAEISCWLAIFLYIPQTKPDINGLLICFVIFVKSFPFCIFVRFF